MSGVALAEFRFPAYMGSKQMPGALQKYVYVVGRD
jgi:hypothetical protein